MISTALSLEAIVMAMTCLCSTRDDGVNYFNPVIVGRTNNLNTSYMLPTEINVLKNKLISRLIRLISTHSTHDIENHCPTEPAQDTLIVLLHVPNYPKVFPIPCNRNHLGAGWMIVQQRFDGSVNFFRSWQEYQMGFGSNLNGEFFIGLERLHALTTMPSKSTELLIILEDFDKDRRYAHFDSFEIGNANELYALKRLGIYSGNAGDSLRVHVGNKFSTFDRDNDNYDGNCAIEYTGAWWYGECLVSNLNGQYLNGTVAKDKYARGMSWTTFRDLEYSLKSVQIMIRTK